MTKKEYKKPKLIFLITFLVIGLSLVQLIISHRLATLGGSMRQLEEKQTYLAEENKKLSEEINQMGSLSLVASKAEEIGLVKAKKVLHLTPQIPVALDTLKIED
jgi:cell division protein FtsL